MDGVGMVYASKKKVRITVAATTAKTIASVHSLVFDFFFRGLDEGRRKLGKFIGK